MSHGIGPVDFWSKQPLAPQSGLLPFFGQSSIIWCGPYCLQNPRGLPGFALPSSQSEEEDATICSLVGMSQHVTDHLTLKKILLLRQIPESS